MERRKNLRFPIRRKLRWWIPKGSEEQASESIDMGSKSIHIACPGQKPFFGSKIEIVIEWPFPLRGESGRYVDLQMHVAGRVLRHTEHGFVVYFTRHEFKTKGSKG